MRRLFISDLHLNPANPDLTRLACEFLDSMADDVDEVYILGDIFNTWLGDDLVPAEFKPFVTSLQNLSAEGVRLFLMVGNRDFMLGKGFARDVSATLLDDGHQITIGQLKTELMHGDSLCTDDVSYQRYRRVVRNRLLQWCFLNLPASFRQKISDKIIAKSKQKKAFKTSMIMDVNQAAVQSEIATAGVQLLIHGHTHRPAIHKLTNNPASFRVVLGDWDNHISYLLADDQQLMLHDHRVSKDQQTLRVA